MDIALQWTSDAFSDTLVSFVNSIKTVDGGTHMEGLKVVPSSFIAFSFAYLTLLIFICHRLFFCVSITLLIFNKLLSTLFVSFLICFQT